MVVDQTGRGERSYDILSRLLKERIIILSEPLTSANCAVILAELIFLDYENEEADLTLYVQRLCGNPSDVLAVYDVLQNIRPPIRTICYGAIDLLGTCLVASGDEGRRYALPHSKFILNTDLGASNKGGSAEDRGGDLDIGELSRVLARHCKQPLQKIVADIKSGSILNAKEAKRYGIVDGILQPG
jgi:ATP-dependent Clp protease protease subunit